MAGITRNILMYILTITSGIKYARKEKRLNYISIFTCNKLSSYWKVAIQKKGNNNHVTEYFTIWAGVCVGGGGGYIFVLLLGNQLSSRFP
jgi:hypothetical protein